MNRSLAFYRDRLGFSPAFVEEGFCVLRGDGVEIHLWAATDETWRDREASPPIVSGAESFIAGTASCRIEVSGIDELHESLHPHDILHPNAPLSEKWYGVREFGVLDPDRNLITFYERRA